MNSGSGSGGFYKYRCKYFYTYNCSNWVYVSNAPCANCLVHLEQHRPQPSSHTKANKHNSQAEGRDSAAAPAQPWANKPREIQVPYLDDHGVLQYSLMEIVHTEPSGLYWEVRQKVANPQLPTGPPTTSDQPRAPFYATSGMSQAHA